jgi:hypothetical protein
LNDDGRPPRAAAHDFGAKVVGAPPAICYATCTMRKWSGRVLLLGVLGFAVVGACSVSDSKKKSSSGGGDDGSGGAPMPGVTEQCEAICVPMHPNGEQNYRDLRNCMLCYACYDACKDDAGPACPMGQEQMAGCSAQAGGDCTACLAGACALVQNPDTTFAGVCAQGASICSMNVECVGLNNCVAECVQSTVAASTSMASGVTSTGAATTGTGM